MNGSAARSSRPFALASYRAYGTDSMNETQTHGTPRNRETNALTQEGPRDSGAVMEASA